MVVVVSQAMIVPLSNQGVNGCSGVDNFHSSRDLCLKSSAMEPKPKGKGGVYGVLQGGHTARVWPRPSSEESISSIESLPGGEALYSPSDLQPSVFRKTRAGLHISESMILSDDDTLPDVPQEEFQIGKPKRLLPGGATLTNSSMALSMDEAVPDHGSTPSEEFTCTRVKFMCSFGGKILPRPSDGKLRYVGGETRIIAVNRDTSYVDLISKMMESYGQALILKYQLPDEDLDALVSVSSDEDLENMMEEYDKLETADVSSRLRVFLFSSVDYESSLHIDSVMDQRNSEQRYVDAVNGIPESGSRKPGDAVGGINAQHFENLISLDLSDSWCNPRGQESVVPVALLSSQMGPQGSQEVASLIHHVPAAFSTLKCRSNAPSAPSSAPSSPPLLSRPPVIPKPPIANDMHLQESHSLVTAQQYSLLSSDGNYQDSENYGGSAASSGTGLHDLQYWNPDPRRGPESPPKKQLEMNQQHEMNHQEHGPRVVDQRRLTEAKVPRVASHGKLARLSEHLKMTAPSRSEAQGISEALLPLPQVDLQRLLLQQPPPPPMLPMQQTAWQHSLDPQQDGYRRMDAGQRTIASGQQETHIYQQQGQLQPLLFRTGLAPGHEVYRQAEQAQQQVQQLQDDTFSVPFLPRSVSSHAIGPPVAAGQSSYPVGSAPSSPRLGFRDLPTRHLGPPQQLPMQWTLSGPAYIDQQHGRRLHNFSDQSGRSFRPSNSPPRYRDIPQDYLNPDYFNPTDERLLRQQQQQQNLVSFDPILHEQVPSSMQLMYEANAAPQPQYGEMASRSQVSHYKGLNPFQEKLISYQDHPDSGETRRINLGIDNQILTGQQHFHPLHSHQRLDFKDAHAQPVEQMPLHSPFQESRDKVTEWVLQQRNHDVEEPRMRVIGRGSRIGQPDYLEEEIIGDSGAGKLKESQKGNYAGLHLPETSDDLLAPPLGETYIGGLRRSDRLEASGDSSFLFRSGVIQASAVAAGYSAAVPRGIVPDGAQAPHFSSRPVEADFLPLGAVPRSGFAGQDLRTTFHELGGNQHVPSSLGPNILQIPGSHKLIEDRPAGGGFNATTSQSPAHLGNMRMGNAEALMNNDVHWAGGIVMDDGRVDALQQGRERPVPFDDRLSNWPNLGGSKCRLSRPSSGSSIVGVDDELLQKASFSNQGDCGSLLDNDPLPPFVVPNVQVIENPLFSTATSVASVPPVTTDIFPTSSVLPNMDASLLCSSLQDLNSVTSGFYGATGIKQFSSKDLLSENIEVIASSINPEVEHEVTTEGTTSKNKEMLPGQLSLTQHLAEDMASSVLEASVPLQEPHLESKLDGVQDSLLAELIPAVNEPWTLLQSAPTFSEQLWEKTVDSASLPDDGTVEEGNTVNEATLETQPGPVGQKLLEGTKVGSPKSLETVNGAGKSTTFENCGSDAAAEAIARGLQTIKNADLEELRELGSGTFGTVYHGKWKGTDVAIKRIKASCFAGRPSEQERLIADFWREACNLGHLHHPNVVAFYGVVSDGPGGTLATVTEYMVNGSLKQVLQKKDRTIDRRKRLLIAMDAGFGMEYLHGKNIVHFDLKCENLLVNMRDPHRPICKVGDLGLSKVKQQTMVSGGVRGTLPWMAPELLNGSSSMVTEKVDVFSFGIVMWELLTGEEPYANMHYGAIIGGIVSNTLRPPIPSWCDPGWRALMERCWSVDPGARPSFSEIASELRAMAGALSSKSH